MVILGGQKRHHAMIAILLPPLVNLKRLDMHIPFCLFTGYEDIYCKIKYQNLGMNPKPTSFFSLIMLHQPARTAGIMQILLWHVLR
jgi:hypothetical protein